MAIEIFISYAHEDEKLMKKLEKQLTILQRHGYITTWHDRKINAGQEWNQEISTHLNKAQIILLLISTDFMVSNYCYSVEVKEALQRHDAGECHVIPIILRPTFWKNAQFNKLQALPTNGKPVSEWSNKDKAFLDIAEGVHKVIEGLSLSPSSKITDEVTIEKLKNEQIKLEVNKKEIHDDLSDWDEVLYMDEDEPLFPLPTSSIIAKTQQNIDIKPVYEETNVSPTLTVEQVKDKWELIKRRIKTKKDGTMISAVLNNYTIVGIEGTEKLPIIVIKASAKFHYDLLQKVDRAKIIEWAMSIELKQECVVGLLPPGKSEIQVLPPPPTRIVKSTSNSLPAPAPHSPKIIENNEAEYDF